MVLATILLQSMCINHGLSPDIVIDEEHKLVIDLGTFSKWSEQGQETVCNVWYIGILFLSYSSKSNLAFIGSLLYNCLTRLCRELN